MFLVQNELGVVVLVDDEAGDVVVVVGQDEAGVVEVVGVGVLLTEVGPAVQRH